MNRLSRLWAILRSRVETSILDCVCVYVMGVFLLLDDLLSLSEECRIEVFSCHLTPSLPALGFLYQDSQGKRVKLHLDSDSKSIS